ncbi:TIR domain-containing protein [Thalassospira sp. MA62]|nr:TIR domain-containing protein [Thalassospira sp. MA62]
MARKVFFSFHFKNDFWRTQTVRNMGALDGQTLASPNKWEELKRTSDQAVRNWIDSNMKGKSCLVVLNGESTAGRKWINYEIKKAWEDGRGVVGIHVNKLKHSDGTTSTRGSNPFANVTANGYSLLGLPKLWIPGGSTSQDTYNSISANISNWIEEAIQIRKKYPGAL